MPVRLRPVEAAVLAPALARFRADAADQDDLRLLVKHFLAVLTIEAPGRAVEVRVPPYAAVQCVGGTRHTRGTPPAVVELDAATWVGLALGDLAWGDALATGRIAASGERSDLGPLLPLSRGESADPAAPKVGS